MQLQAQTFDVAQKTRETTAVPHLRLVDKKPASAPSTAALAIDIDAPVYDKDHPLFGLENSDFWFELQNHDPMSCAGATFDYLVSIAPTQRVSDWLAGFRDCRRSMAIIAAVPF